LTAAAAGIVSAFVVSGPAVGGVFVLTCPTCGPRPMVRLAADTAAGAAVIHTVIAPPCPACGAAQNFTEAK
jgi:hypothetical protein